MELTTLDLIRQRSAEVLGTDLARAENGDLAMVHGGLAVQSGEAVAVLDIAERIATERGTEFYDRAFGEILDNWVEDEDTESNRLQLLMELRLAIQADPRVVNRSAQAKVEEWSEEPRLLRVRAGWIWITGEVVSNLVIEADGDGTKVIQSFNPTPEAEVE